MTFLVRDYDEAIAWFTRVLRFTVIQDLDLGEGKRWVEVAPVRGGTSLVLARAAGRAQVSRVGDQAGGRVLLFLHTGDFYADYAHMRAQGVVFEEEPRHESYGVVAVFRDLYGNSWDLIQP